MPAPTIVAKPLLLNALASDETLLAEVLNGLEHAGLCIEMVGELEEGIPRGSVLTVWSRASILDERVVRNADLAQQAECLIPVRIDDVEPPSGFRQIRTYDVVQLSEEAGAKLALDLRRLALDAQQGGSRKAVASTSILIRSIEWTFFVTAPVAIFVPAISWLFGYSSYVTFIFAAPIIADTAVIGVPAFLRRLDAAPALSKLTHCGRVDLGLQLTLTLLFGLFVRAQSPNASIATGMILTLRYLASAAAGLATRHIAVGLWLVSKERRLQLSRVASLWAVAIGVPLLTYCSASWFLLKSFFSWLAFIFSATSTALSIALDFPAFESTGAATVSSARASLLKLTLLDMLVQTGVATVEGWAWHDANGQPILTAITRVCGCAAAAIVCRHVLLRAGYLGRRQTR